MESSRFFKNLRYGIVKMSFVQALFFAGRTNYHIYLTMVINALNMVA